MSVESPVLTVKADGPVRIVTFNKPDTLNAMSRDLRMAVNSLWHELGDDWEARVVVLTGAGRAFSAGGDVPEFVETIENEDLRRANFREAGRLVAEMVRFHLPVISAVNGPAVGLGASIAVMADIVFMADNAFMADPHVAMGLVAADGGVVTWPLMMSLLRAKEYLFTGERIPARDALSMGLANRVVPADALLDEAVVFAHKLAALPAQALQDTKRALNLHVAAAANAVLPFALMAEELSFGSGDVARKVGEFGARRKPATEK
ncbi:enoyl-CoA hydratase/isomerase family protein [Amycolatopsis sp. NPDC006131]|uniref:enoyl-CoA hydratase/isomerase family protein n=1 Tax=Amycolatopsis sp. NPDC006131 TaxID=3156731 RepID=UPI0033A17020